MKKLFPKMFFVSDCAKGMLFALTLATVGNYLWGSLFHLLLLWAGEPRPVLLWTFAVGALAITLYSFALAVISLVGLVKVLRRKRRFKALWYLVPAGGDLALGAVGVYNRFCK